MEEQKPDESRPRAYIFGRKFHLGRGEEAMGVMIQEKKLVPVAATDWDSDRVMETATVFGFHTPPVIPALWRSLTTKQPGCLLVRTILRAKAVFNNFRDLWNDFCSWSSHRQFDELEPQPRNFSLQDHLYWRGLKAAQYQIGYQDPSAEPKWRMKQIIEVKEYDDVNREFHVASSNLHWTWRNRKFGSTNWKFHIARAPNGNHKRTVREPLW